MSNPTLTAALSYARRNWPVFPLRPASKRPLSRRGFLDATLDPTLVSDWWRRRPDAGIGIATGGTAGLLVLDIDPAKGGADSLVGLGPVPPTVECLTGGGGRHFYFQHPGGEVRSGVGLWPGIDLRADGGYVCAPPSSHPSGGTYSWQEGSAPGDREVAPTPDWLLERLRNGKSPLPDPMRVFPEGTRNDGLASLAGAMLRRGMSATAVLSALLEENETRCLPPLEIREVERIVEGLYKRYRPSFESSPGLPPSAAIPKRLELLDVGLLVDTDPLPVNWIVERRIAQGDVVLLAGQEGAGKSWMTLEVAIAGGGGRPILGRFRPWKLLTTLVVDEENPRDEVHRRLRALKLAWGIPASELADRVMVSRPCQGFTFRSEGYTKALIELVEKRRPDLIILDSATALSNAVDDNRALHTRRFFHDCLYPLRDVCGSTILLIHHMNKASWQTVPMLQGIGQVRGGDYAAASDCVLTLAGPATANDGEPRRVVLRVEKTRRGITPDPLLYRIVDGQPQGTRPMVFDIEDTGDEPDGPDAPGFASVREAIVLTLGGRGDTWTDSSSLRGWVQLGLPGMNRRSFNRVLTQLIGDGVIEERGETEKGEAKVVKLRETVAKS